jgi:signal peptidase I
MKSTYKGAKTISYAGASMNPTLWNLDKLFYVPYEGGLVKEGDVVVINSPSGRKIIHRVQSINSLGIKTMGDNNPTADPWLLRQDQIIGKVVYVLRGRRMICIHGGFRGRIYALSFKSIRNLFIMSFQALKVPCNYLERSRLRGFLTVQTRIFAFKHPDGVELQLHMAGHVIGRRRPGGKWQIRPPFWLLLKKETLRDGLVVEGSFD